MSFERLISIPTCARLAGRSRVGMWRLLLKMHAEDARLGNPTDWLVKSPGGGKFHINLARLKVTHPALFAKRYVDREEYEELVERVAECETADREQGKRINSLSARIRSVETAGRGQK